MIAKGNGDVKIKFEREKYRKIWRQNKTNRESSDRQTKREKWKQTEKGV